jgi:hypothetical protein
MTLLLVGQLWAADKVVAVAVAVDTHISSF